MFGGRLKVLVQWLPSASLRAERDLALGAKWASEVQQVSIDFHDPEYAEAYVLATRGDDGVMRLQVGFKGQAHFNGVGWIRLIDPKTPVAEAVHYYDETPTNAKLVRDAKRADPRPAAAINALAKVVRKTRKKMAREHEESQKAQFAERRRTSPYANPDAFDAVAAVKVVEVAPDGSERLLGAAEVQGMELPPSRLAAGPAGPSGRGVGEVGVGAGSSGLVSRIAGGEGEEVRDEAETPELPEEG